MPFATDRITRAGGRQHNEDACGDLWLGSAGCWVVADGLGGHRGGETASTVAVQAVLASFQSNPEPSLALLQQHLEAAQQAVLRVQKEDPRLAGMRTTIVVLVADSRQALWAHVGDSRLYCLDAGRIAFYTRDHSVVQAMVNAGDLPARDIRHHPDRNRLLRALGNSDGPFRPEILAQARTLYRGTTFLLCTDGFWENVSEAEMEIDLAKADSPRDWLAKMETRVLERTNADSDNYSAIAVVFDSESAPLAPAPKLVEDCEMNGGSKPGLSTTVALAGIMLIALASAALGVWNWFRIRDLSLQQAQVRNPAPQQQLAGDQLKQRIDSLELRLDSACKSDAELKVLCDPNAEAANAGTAAASETGTNQAESTVAAKSKPKKAKKVKKGSNGGNS